MQQHFEEIKSRFINCAMVFGIIFISCFYFANSIYTLISAPILAKLPHGIQLITTQVTAPFMVPIQLSFLIALLIVAPFIMHQIWMFVRPGLYPKERSAIAPLIVFSTILFYCGIAFAWLVICPVAIQFFTKSAPNGVTVMLDIGDYLNFIVTVAIASGLAFQIPVIIRILIRAGIMSKEQLAAKRKHVIVLALVVGMLLAPPDVISQLLLAIPMWLLFEFGLKFTGKLR